MEPRVAASTAPVARRMTDAMLGRAAERTDVILSGRSAASA